MKPFLYNSTRKKALAEKGEVLRGFSTGLGAMFRGLPGSLVLVWWRPARVAITNLFVPEDLDILWLDEHWKIVDIHERFPAGALHTKNKHPAKYIIELTAGTIARTKTKLGDAVYCTAIKL